MAVQFLSFIRENRAGALLSGAAALCTYGAWMTRQDITVDTEIMMADPDAMMNSWLGINRFGLVFTKHLFGQTAFHPVLSRVLTVILLWITAMVLSFFVYKWSGGQKRFRLFSAVFPVVYVTAPCFAEQLYFVLQSAEVVFAMLLCVLAASGAGQFAFFGGKWFWAAGSILLLAWAFGTYQAMAAVAASLIVILFMTVYLGKNGKEQDRQRFGWLLAGVKLAAVFVIGFVLYMAAAAAVRTLSGGSEAYVADMMHWKKDGFNVCVHWIAGELRRVFDCYYVMFRPEFGWAVLLFFISSLEWMRRRKRPGKLWYLAAVCVFLLSPFLMTLVAGYYQPIRAHLVYPLVFASALSFLTAFLWPEEEAAEGEKMEKACAGKDSTEKSGAAENGREKHRKRAVQRRKGAAFAAAALCLLISWSQAEDGEALFETVHQVSEQDIGLTREIYGKAQEMADREGRDIQDCVFIFLGKREPELPAEALRGDVIGCSFYQWDAESPMGISRRIYDLMQALELPSKEPVLSRYLDSLPFAEGMACYPEEGSVRMDEDTVIVKLSEPEEG